MKTQSFSFKPVTVIEVTPLATFTVNAVIAGSNAGDKLPTDTVIFDKSALLSLLEKLSPSSNNISK